jgi:hypothetical protein
LARILVLLLAVGLAALGVWAAIVSVRRYQIQRIIRDGGTEALLRKGADPELLFELRLLQRGLGEADALFVRVLGDDLRLGEVSVDFVSDETRAAIEAWRRKMADVLPPSDR